MNVKIVAISVIAGLVVVGGGFFAYTSNQNQNNEQEKLAMEQKSEDEAAMMKKDEAEVMQKDSTETTGEVMTKSGAYVTLADYNANPDKFADSKKVYFFHADWCTICRGIDKEITNDLTKIPAGVTIIKTNFDKDTDLRQKYGVTTQYTFVQVDSSGNETAQWSATSLDSALNGIQS